MTPQSSKSNKFTFYFINTLDFQSIKCSIGEIQYVAIVEPYKLTAKSLLESVETEL
jgi:hypothetical protein